MNKTTFKASLLSVAIAASFSVNADQQILDDLIIDGSLCVGVDCANGESFGADTIRLKENNLRIHFQDTSNSASFPTTDWRIEINDSTNGGGSHFAIQNADTNAYPFKIDAGARSNALYIDAQGDIGIGTSSPVVELQVTDGDTPTLRLQQDGSQGWSSQTWDIAGNETNFFVRDVTNGSALPFRIKPGADENALFIAANNNIGLGTDNPSDSLTISKSVDPSILIKSTGAAASDKNFITMQNAGDSQIVYENTSAGAATWKTGTYNNSFFIVSPQGDGQEFEVDLQGNLTTSGTVNGASSRAIKENIANVDVSSVLDKLATLDVFTWNYIKDNDNISHLGPMAEDFHKAFGLNGDATDKISYTDITGVAIAAVKALQTKLEAKEQELSLIKERLDNLEKTKN
ncbi:tail fiber domain-containing protein [Pseudoalteromonas sp. YIC-656]|uniref:tail fiber domain-containing protein n=1 Tax=Pseudoalteromonas pernae TaxID=3118054 RepID=UPI003242CC2D